jgi:hypothetical protein
MDILRKLTEKFSSETGEYGVGVLVIAPDGEFIS